jgi:hypothetical protein
VYSKASWKAAMRSWVDLDWSIATYNQPFSYFHCVIFYCYIPWSSFCDSFWQHAEILSQNLRRITRDKGCRKSKSCVVQLLFSWFVFCCFVDAEWRRWEICACAKRQNSSRRSYATWRAYLQGGCIAIILQAFFSFRCHDVSWVIEVIDRGQRPS